MQGRLRCDPLTSNASQATRQPTIELETEPVHGPPKDAPFFTVHSRNPIVIEKVNLLDPSQEPTDEQLENLMQSVALKARSRAAIADAALWDTLRRQAAEAREKFNLCPPPAPAEAT